MGMIFTSKADANHIMFDCQVGISLLYYKCVNCSKMVPNRLVRTSMLMRCFQGSCSTLCGSLPVKHLWVQILVSERVL
jgi:hypothetical protein